MRSSGLQLVEPESVRIECISHWSDATSVHRGGQIGIHAVFMASSRQFHLPQFGVGRVEGAQAFHTSKTKLSGHVATRAMSRVWNVVMPVAFATELTDCLRFRL